MTTGGRLQQLAEANNIPVFKIEHKPSRGPLCFFIPTPRVRRNSIYQG
jgi:hypothetical protein